MGLELLRKLKRKNKFIFLNLKQNFHLFFLMLGELVIYQYFQFIWNA